MGTDALALKYRPKDLHSLVGQNIIKTTVKNMIATRRIPHAILLVGSRGTGKTTTARIIAKAVNCLNPDPEKGPCCKCAACTSIDSGKSSDVIEIDGASNRGVEAIKKIRQDAQYSSLFCEYRVFVVDEVHMLSTEAFNALLKTLEEPPPHVIFIFATTDYDKLPDTIISRCIQLNFMRIKASDIVSRLKYVCRNEGIAATDEALGIIANYVNGGMRDALSNLDKISAFSTTIDADIVRDILGIISEDTYADIINFVLDGDAASTVSALDTLLSQGADMRLFLENLIYFILDVAKTKMNIAMPDKPVEYKAKMKLLAVRLSDSGIDQLVLIIKELIKDISRFDGSLLRAIVELSVPKLIEAAKGQYKPLDTKPAIEEGGTLATKSDKKRSHSYNSNVPSGWKPVVRPTSVPKQEAPAPKTEATAEDILSMFS